MNIDSLKQAFDLLARKYQEGVFSGEEFTIFVNIAQKDMADWLIGRVQEYQPGRPIPRVNMEIDKVVAGYLSPLVVSDSLSVVSGNVTKPSTFRAMLDMRLSSGETIKWVPRHRLAGYFSDVIDPLSDSNAIYLENNGYWNIYPTTITTIDIDYIKQVPDAVWGSQVINDEEVYNAVTSVDPVWGDNLFGELLGRVLKLAGIPLKDSDLVNYGNQVITQGE